MAGFWGALFDRTKASQAASVYVEQTSRAVPTPRNYATFGKEGYQLNVIAYRCISLIAESASGIPLTLYRGDAEASDHPMLELMDKPSPAQDGVSFRTAVHSYDLLAGNYYIERMRAGSTVELYAHRPDRMTIVPGSAGIPRQFVYKVGQRSTEWDVDPVTGKSDILHGKHFHPLNDWYGQSPLEAAAYSIDQHNAASLWNMGVLQNSGKPSGALKYAPREGDETMPEEMYQRLKAELDDHRGAKGRPGRQLLLEGGLDWVQMAMSAMDLDWLNGIDKAASYIAQVFNVPEQLVGVPGQQTYNNYREARLALYEDAVLPAVDRFCRAFTEWHVRPELGPQWRLTFNEDDVPALAPRKEQQWDRIQAADDLSINEKRKAKGYEPVEGGDVILVPAGQLPLSFAAMPPTFPEPPEGGEPEDIEKAHRLAYGGR